MPDDDKNKWHDLFISYSHDDLARVLPDVEWLRSQRYDVWFDSQLRPGREWASELARAIDESRFMIFFASERSIKSPHCLNEIAYATDANKVVVPVYLEQLEMAGGAKLAVSRSQAILRWHLSLEEYRQHLRSVVALNRGDPVDAALEPAPRKDGIWHVPLTRNRNFAGRDAVLDSLATRIRERAPAVVALTGLAGVGKSQIALEYAFRHKREYDVVAWIRGEETAALEADFVSLAEELGLAEAADPNTAVVLNAVKRHLAARSGWLLVFDNIERPETLLRYLPADPNGHVIITSRWRNWGRYADNLSVDPFEGGQAVEFMERRLASADPAATRRLVDMLGRLPLALEEAAAYMEMTGRSTDGYIELFENHHRALLAQVRPPDDYPWTFRTALEVSLLQLQTEDDKAVHMLKLLSFVAPDDIAVSVVLRNELSGGEEPLEIAVDRCISALARYSMIKVERDAVSVHRLVQLVIRDRMSPEEYERYATRVLELMEDEFPAVKMMGELAAKCRRLVPHAIALFGHVADLASAQYRSAVLMGRIGTFLSASSWSEQAIRYLDRAYSILRSSTANEATLAYTCELYGGSLYRHGLLDRARELFDEAIAIYERSGQRKANRGVLIHTNLAWIYWSQGEFARAEAAALQALAVLKAAFGERDPRRIGPLTILARIYMELRLPSDAERVLVESIETLEALRGYRVPLMCGAFMQMAHVLLSLGKPQRAQSWAREALAAGAAALSDSHPLIATSHCVLGQVMLTLGEPEAARRELEASMIEVADADYRVNQHQVVGACFLARALIELGDLDAAQQLARGPLAKIAERIAGDNHYAVGLAALVRGLLECRLEHKPSGVGLGVDGDARVRERYGDEHAYRIDTLALLGDIQREAGLPSEARVSYEQGLNIARVNGLDAHPRAADHLLGLAALDEAEGNRPAADAARGRAAAVLALCLGPSHERVLALQT